MSTRTRSPGKMPNVSLKFEWIRSAPDTPRQCVLPRETLGEARAAIERHLKNGYLRQVQAPVGVKPILKAWMELA